MWTRIAHSLHKLASGRVPARAILRDQARGVLKPVVDFGELTVLRWPLAYQFEVAPLRGFLARELQPHELPATAARLGQPAAVWQLRSLHGDRCFCTFYEGEPVHVKWVARVPTWVPDVDLYLAPGKSDACLYEAFTVPAYRGLRAAALARREVKDSLAAEGVEAIFSYVVNEGATARPGTSDGWQRLFTINWWRPGGGRVRLDQRPAPPLYAAEELPELSWPDGTPQPRPAKAARISAHPW